MVKSRKVTQEITEYFTICPECNKEIKGSTEGQVLYNLSIHMTSKHYGFKKMKREMLKKINEKEEKNENNK